jgi:hypothetical protein
VGRLVELIERQPPRTEAEWNERLDQLDRQAPDIRILGLLMAMLCSFLLLAAWLEAPDRPNVDRPFLIVLSVFMVALPALACSAVWLSQWSERRNLLNQGAKRGWTRLAASRLRHRTR